LHLSLILASFTLITITQLYLLIIPTGTGYFKPTWGWNLDTSPKMVKTPKENYPQLRVVISIGGLGAEYPFSLAGVACAWNSYSMIL